MISYEFMGTGAIMLLGAFAPCAQAAEVLTAHIPFTFKVGSAVLPPGEYELTFDRTRMPDVLLVQAQHGREGAFVLTQRTDVPKASGDQTKLVFEKDGTQYELATVFDPGDAFGIQILGTHAALSEERGEATND